MRSLPSRAQIQERLGVIFPRSAFDPVHSNPLAAAALAAMLYIDAVVPDEGDAPSDAVWARPTTCLWMSDEVYARDSAQDRVSWRKAAARGRRAMEELQASWGLPHAISWYRDNSRETLRDETFPAWLDYGAIRNRPGIRITSSLPRWALSASFADYSNLHYLMSNSPKLRKPGVHLICHQETVSALRHSESVSMRHMRSK
jgi:hypothetical protein